MVCRPSGVGIAQAYFNYGKDDLNGTDPENWMPADHGVSSGLTKGLTVKANSPALYYIQVAYNGGLAALPAISGVLIST